MADGKDGKNEIGPEEYMDRYGEELTKQIRLTKKWLRLRYGDRIVDSMGMEDFLQETVLAMWRNRTNPKFLRWKCALQQKTFYQKRYFKRPVTTQYSQIAPTSRENYDGILFEESHYMEAPSPTPTRPTEEDWMVLARKHSLRPVDVTIIRMRVQGISVRNIALALGLTVSTVHIRIKEVKRRVKEAKNDA